MRPATPGSVQPTTMNSSRLRHLVFSQAPPRSPGRYGATARFETIPLAPSLHAWRKNAGPCRRRDR
jgi:hypothetical protein